MCKWRLQIIQEKTAWALNLYIYRLICGLNKIKKRYHALFPIAISRPFLYYYWSLYVSSCTIVYYRNFQFIQFQINLCHKEVVGRGNDNEQNFLSKFVRMMYIPVQQICLRIRNARCPSARLEFHHAEDAEDVLLGSYIKLCHSSNNSQENILTVEEITKRLRKLCFPLLSKMTVFTAKTPAYLSVQEFCGKLRWQSWKVTHYPS